jgi:hypothetical protein
MAGFGLVTVGILCLSLSGAVARPGTWWQGTWQALGVGFVVGGIVDVLAISAMTRASTYSQRYWNGLGWQIVSIAETGKEPRMVVGSATYILEMSRDALDPELRARLTRIVENAPYFQAASEDPASPTQTTPSP